MSRSGLDKEDCCLDIRKETGQKEEFLYKRTLFYSIDFPGRLDVHTFRCNVSFETHAREMPQKVRSHAEKRSWMPRFGSTRVLGSYHAFKRDRRREGCVKCFCTSKITEDISCKIV